MNIFFKSYITGSIIIFLFIFNLNFTGCTSTAVSAEEYFSIGMAYYDLGKYDEAEKWLNRAKQANRTMVASQYNLGRLAFETKRYQEAAGHFEDILKVDANNVLALRAAAYTRIRTGDIDLAEKHYNKLLELIPDSIDDGYNHALVLFAMGHFHRAEEVLEKYPYSLQDNNEIMLLYARSQKAQGKVEAIESFDKWLSSNSDITVQFEYAQVLESHEFYARALEEYRQILHEDIDETKLKAADVHFSIARVLLIADSESIEGITELETAINEGFNDIEAIEELADSGKLSASNLLSLRNIIDNLHRNIEPDTGSAAEQETDPMTIDEQNQPWDDTNLFPDF
jgi:tetratricopeptide (TPR) repeat protein